MDCVGTIGKIATVYDESHAQLTAVFIDLFDPVTVELTAIAEVDDICHLVPTSLDVC